MKRIMVVDDSRVARLQIKDMLMGTDYEIAAFCGDGDEAIDEYANVLPDLVTMDILMPGTDGLEAARELLELYPDARIIMVSSMANDETYGEAVDIGTKGYLYKPFDKKMILDAFEKALQ